MKRKDAKGRIREHLRVVKGHQLTDVLGAEEANEASTSGDKKKGKAVNVIVNGTGYEAPEGSAGGEEWRIWDRECFYVEETGEIFTDYE